MDIAHLHFLVAHADPHERRALAALLAQIGACRVSEVRDGPSVLEALAAGSTFTPPIDIAIVDLDLPGADSLDLLRHLGKTGCGARLIVSGSQSSDLLFSIETLAQAYGVELLGTLGHPITAVTLKPLLANYTPLARRVHAGQVQRFGFDDVERGLQQSQFEPFFQPKIELATGDVKGLEVFARWRHPEHGVLGPAAFMDALQEHGRINLLDWAMIEQAVARSRWLQDIGLPIPISLNTAPETLLDPAFVPKLVACLAQHDVAPDQITFEMPESATLNTDPDFIERLVRLRMLGIGLAIDDYGTGRSNLQLLARIPFTELKIDRSFVDGASKLRPLSTVLRSCLTLAHSLERQSVAVGVETRQDWDFLQSLGCTYAQGYHIANPMEATAFPPWLADWRQFF